MSSRRKGSSVATAEAKRKKSDRKTSPADKAREAPKANVAQPKPVDPKANRPVLLPGQSLCDHCTAKCCKYFAWPIERPSARSDFDYIRWAMLHSQTTFFVEDDDWYVLVHTTCKHLRPDNLCGIYETRPEICREYSTADCEFDSHYVYEKYFETPEQVYEYMEVVTPPKGQKSIRSAKPPLFQFLN
ncbi:MAG: YkgJ family cysteine cluster protein [Pirellulales bacterium]